MTSQMDTINPFSLFDQPAYGEFGNEEAMNSEPSFNSPNSLFSSGDDIPQESFFGTPFPMSATVTESSPGEVSFWGSVSTTSSSVSTSPLSSPGGSQEEQTQQPPEMSSVVVMCDPTVTMPPLVPTQKKQRKTPSPRQKPVGKKRKAPSDSDEELKEKARKRFGNLTSDEITELYRKRSEQGSLDKNEERVFKTGIRAAKNRESAQRSRENISQVREYGFALADYHKNNEQTWREYACLLKDVLRQNGIEAPPDPVIPAPPPVPVSSRTGANRAVFRTAGFCLMLVLFSVGVLYNVLHHENSTVSVTSGNTEGQFVSQPSTATSDSADPNARVIVEPSTPAPEANRDQPLPDSNTQIASIDMMRKSSYLSCETDKPDSSLALVVSDQKQHATPSAYDMVPTANHLTPETSKTLFGGSEPLIADHSWSVDNTSSYIFVSQANEFIPRTSKSRRIRSDSVKFWFPPSSLDYSKPDTDGIFEVTCDVRNVTFVPRSVLDSSL